MDSDPGADPSASQPGTDDIKELILEEDASTNLVQNRRLLDPTKIVTEDRIVGRSHQLNTITQELRVVINNDPPRNLYLYGPSGTGKSLIINAVCDNIEALSEARDIDFGVIDLNCQNLNTLGTTVYRLIQMISADCGAPIEVPEHGVSTSKQWRELYRLIDENYDSLVFVLDELDLLIGRRDIDEPAFSRLLYQLSRTGTRSDVGSDVTVCAITNDTTMLNHVGSRAQSTFDPVEVHFSDYDANQLREILAHRRDAFRDGVLTSDVIPLTAALSAKTHGDARKAINLFRTAGTLAEREGDSEVHESYVRQAQEEVEKNRVLEVTRGISAQKQLCLFATAAVARRSAASTARSPHGYTVYQWLTDNMDADQYLQETYVNKMKELTTYSLVDYERKSGGQDTGSYLEFEFGEDPTHVIKTVREDSRFEEVDENLLDTVVDAQLGDT